MRVNYFLLLCIGVCFIQKVWAEDFRRIEKQGNVVIESVSGRVIEIRCEAGIAHLIRSGNPESLKVEQVDTRIFVTPFNTGSAELIVLDKEGKSFRLRFSFGDNPETGLILGSNRKEEAFQRTLLSDLGLFLKGLIEEKMPDGSIQQEVSKEIIKNGQTEWRLKKQYMFSSMIGYVFEVKNLSTQGVFVAVEDIIFPGLLAVTIEEEVLHPKGQQKDTTRVFLIARQS